MILNALKRPCTDADYAVASILTGVVLCIAVLVGGPIPAIVAIAGASEMALAEIER